jgi:hypothetical protein
MGLHGLFQGEIYLYNDYIVFARSCFVGPTKKKLEDGENYMTRGFVICPLYQI